MTAMTTDRVAILAEGEVLVHGTLDPVEALRLYVEETAGDDFDEVARPDPLAEDVAWLADYLHGMLLCAESGYYRQVECLPGSIGWEEEWAWELRDADRRDDGAFPAVYFATC